MRIGHASQATRQAGLAAVDLLARVEPAAVPADGLGALDRLGVDDRGGRLGLAAGRETALAAQLMVHSLGRAGFLPAVQLYVPDAA